MKKSSVSFLAKSLGLAFLFTVMVFSLSFGKAPKREYYEIKIYHVSTQSQQERVHKYLKDALLPALHKIGITKVGVFKPVESDTANGKLIYLLIPFKSVDQHLELPELLLKDSEYLSAGAEYLDAAFDNAPYNRIESIFLKAFAKFPESKVPNLTTPHAERIYEFRSYESATEKIHLNKVQMFNDGGEVNLFERLEFNPVFFAQVISGSHMPNLMYMTSFNNKAAREAHWDVFKTHPDWKKMSGLKEYQKNVSHSDILFLHPTDYSDL